MGERVLLHVYDLSPMNAYAYDFGFGAFHSGVEVNSVEHTFAGNESSSSGIVRHPPKQVPSARFRISIDMGETNKSSSEIEAELAFLGQHFQGNTYHPVMKNCNHFSDAFCQALVGKRIPGWINRLANMGSCFSCLLPTGNRSYD
ncbi:hypothetical protein GUITHDRAFT_81819 [Guillardia theta CCMP2712]|uniref:PPPDE domain-containing protein n=1 Tax=Guillardia theta (strain CCMP2712) TaxID=905079 RepID=L1I9Z2_GUITC|nr:hypothetical protein GUITHDRAFT_81819 [Guillardia theta CCMP2712]EKX33048.1 hypothetical protein GUITHDRAFT_81819 [Guillardia theta CCMP2712]|eukprot:XP_005820028.1 hypothetical protein GUITHDRAFT_81819 [Guillardia theta CCMP2712]